VAAGGSEVPVGFGAAVVAGWDVGVDVGTLALGVVVGATVGTVVDVSD